MNIDKIRSLVLLKIESIEKVIAEIENSTYQRDDYQCGQDDGYLEASELELTSLKQILDLTKEV